MAEPMTPPPEPQLVDSPRPGEPQEADKEKLRAPNLGHRTYYNNRELSWLEFNRRVLEEALDESNPLLERVKFLAIFTSNLDEFFMVRVSGLRRQHEAGALEPPPDGMTPAEQLAAIRETLEPMLLQRSECWQSDLLPQLAEAGIRVLSYDDLKNKQRKLLRRHFKREIYPALTPLAFDPGHPFPHISNLSINLAVEIRDPNHGERFARLKVPHLFSRLLRVPSEDRADSIERLGLQELRSTNFVWLEDVVAANLDLLFPGLEIVSAYPFRVTRDADLEIEEDEAADLLSAMQEVVGMRHFGSAIRLEVDARMPKRIRKILSRNLGLAPYQSYESEAALGLSDLMQLLSLERPELKDPPFLPVHPPSLTGDEPIFSVLRERDVLLYHPYDSFAPVVRFIREAAEDPHVVSIKITLYRAGPDSPIVAALKKARERGKQVSALVELKARFDEESNIEWARALELAGVHVVYGIVGLKVHTKMALVARREPEGMRQYLHLGTGNYNPVTAKIYTDLGLLTSNRTLATDVSDVFNSLTGYSAQHEHSRVLVAPHGMRDAMLGYINREIERHREHGDGYIALKMNSLVDKGCIKALYRASRAGVRVELSVRGICCLRPGVPRVSENIRVISIVGRFLEHTRIYYFRNGGDETILVGSADLMPRNLDGRVELLFPIEDEALRHSIRDEILLPQFRDTARARELQSDGTYVRLQPAEGEKPFDCQVASLAQPGSWHREV